MKHTRVLALVLALCMVLSMLPATAYAAPILLDQIQAKRGAANQENWPDMKVNRILKLMPGDMSTLDVGDNTFNESEPNDNFETANLLEHDYTIVASLPANDVDHYAFVLDAETEVTILSASTTDKLLFRLYTYDTQEYVEECV